MLIQMLVLAATQLAVPASAAAAPPATPVSLDVPAPDTVSMSLAEVKAFNATVGKDHPYFIRCRSIEVTGSLAKKGRVCRTISEWRQLQDDGNEHARAIVDYSRSRPNGQ